MKSLPENLVLTPRRTNTTVIRCAGLILGFLLACNVAHALDPDRKISQYAQRLAHTARMLHVLPTVGG
jgi:hypothetical protein